MRPLWKDILTAIWLGVIIPGIVLNLFVLKNRCGEEELAQPVQAEEIQPGRWPVQIRDPDGILSEMELDDYLTGVLLAEMPAGFHPEALKAQAVAARTYTWKAHTTGGKHEDGSICTDSVCCQAYLPDPVYLSLGGTTEHLEKVRNAVQATSGIVLYHDGALIEATYFSSASGSTEAAAEVWGADFPYLQAVSSPEEVCGEEVIYTVQEFQQLLEAALPGEPESWFGAVSYTAGGGVAEMEICGLVYTGTKLRSQLGLKSTAFAIWPEGETLHITTRGHGHRVGMSQYGANAMAETGSTWQQILQHYYPGTNLAPLEEINLPAGMFTNSS